MAIETILVAVGSEETEQLDRLTQTVIDIAGPAGATVELLHIFTDAAFDTAVDRLKIADRREASADRVARQLTSVREMVKRIDETDISSTVSGAIGDHADEVVAHAEATDADLLIVGGRRRSPAGKAVFGSTAQAIMLGAPCPVTFVQSSAE
jgi:Universal stress protein UspA and related nucleotide-binding proteins